MKHLLIFLLAFYSLLANAQKDTGRAAAAVALPVVRDIRSLEQVEVTGIQPSPRRLTSLHIEQYSLADMERKSPYNLSDALAQLPGISQLTTGNAISKPVIRGLYGNRILVLLSGLRFDNQQFQDEHGLGLSQIGIERVEIIRGPASILYGTDALGGVINVIEEEPHSYGTTVDAGVRFYSNTLGTLTDVGILHRGAPKQLWWRVRGGYESHGDYSDGNGTRVFDSRNAGYYLKAGAGFDHPHWSMENAYNLSYNQFGFILDSTLAGNKKDDRWSRSMLNPHHNILLNTFSSQNTFYLNRTVTAYNDDPASTTGATLKVAAGFQSNHRAEDEGGGSISLNMHLLSVLESARLEKYLLPKLRFIVNQQTTFEENTNYGKRILIPDAGMLENSFSGFLRYPGRKVVLEGGAGITLKSIHTYETGTLNQPGTAVEPFSNVWTGYNFLGGVSYNPSSTLNIKGNISTGLRAPNLAELSSQGLHEGTYRFELGAPGLRMERVTSGDVTIEKTGAKYSLSASGYLNVFKDYIYLAQTADTVLGLFPLFRYKQQDARIRGLELAGSYRISSRFVLTDHFAYVRGTTAGGGNLPFIPPPKMYSPLDTNPWLERLRQIMIEPEAEYHFRYSDTGPFEIPNPAYLLINLHTAASFLVHRHAYDAGLSFRNLLNAAYTDALSRLRYYGINNGGINVVLSLRTSLHSNK